MEKQMQGSVIALLVANGIRRQRLDELSQGLRDAGARLHLIALHAPPIVADDGSPLMTDADVGNVTPGYYDGLVIPEAPLMTSTLEVDEEAIALLQVMYDERRPMAAVGEGVALLADAGLVKYRRIACSGQMAQLVEEAGGRISDADVESDIFLTSGQADCDLDALIELFAEDIDDARRREYSDERSKESFPASDAHSGSSTMHTF